MKLLIANIAAIVCFTFAFILIIKGINGWGWFLFIGYCATHTYKGDKISS